MMDLFSIKCLIPLTIFITAISAEVIVRKSFDQSIQLDCPACDSNECPISINDVSTTPTASARYSIQNSQLIVPPHDWGSYGRICCGPMDRQSCYTVCPYEICDSCLTLSVNVTAAVVGDGILVISSIRQRPHNGISLFINGIASTDPSADLSCSTKSRVLGHQVIYYCIAKKSGTVTLRTNTEFCETVLNSQQINITIEEQRIMPNETHAPSTIIPPSMSDDIDPTSVVIHNTSITTAMPTVIVSNDNTSTVAFNTTAATTPTEPSRVTADNFDLSAGLIVVIVIVVIMIVLLLILVVAIMILVVICRIRKWNAKRCDTPPLELPDQQLQVHPPVSVADDGSEIGYDSHPASELISQQPYPCEQSHVVQQ